MEDKLAGLNGVRLRIFCYLLQVGGQVGVREVQRALSLKSPSHAAYHLTKLYEDDIVDKTVQNNYVLREEFQQKSVRLNVLTEYYLLLGRFWPRTVFFSTYLVVSLLIALVLIVAGRFMVLSVYIIISLVMSLGVSIYEVYHQIRALPWESPEKI